METVEEQNPITVEDQNDLEPDGFVPLGCELKEDSNITADDTNNSEVPKDISKETKCDFLGTDVQGRHIFGVYAYRFPEKEKLEQFIREIIKEMEPYVENDYILVYFHQGLRNGNRPSAQFLWNFYQELDRNFRKNLKNLYVVHPTWFIRVVWNFFRPFVSEKFRQKLIYISSLEELRKELGLEKLDLPNSICEFDEKLNAGRKGHVQELPEETLGKTAQFGVSLQFIIQNSPCLNYIPPVVRKCVDSLAVIGAIDTEGIFRRSGSHSQINEIKRRINRGEDVSFEDVDVYVIAGLLKSFLRDLKEPLLTFELYDDITKFLEWPKEVRSNKIKEIFKKLPVENYEVFKYLVEFLVKVMEHSEVNKMTSSNLAIVFGPNLVRAKHNKMSLDEINPINTFIDYVLQNYGSIYDVDLGNDKPEK